MIAKRFQDIWQVQCSAARDVKEKHGLASALDYLLGEKLMRYAETATTHPEFARELPRFIAEVRAIFSRDDIRAYLTVLERVESDGNRRVRDRFALQVQKLQRFRHIKELLLAEQLGTS